MNPRARSSDPASGDRAAPATRPARPRRLLITGGTGVLGTALRQAAVGDGRFDVMATSRRPFDGFLELELSQPASIDAAVSRARPDIVIHTAALTSPAEAEREPELAERVNGAGSARLAELCRARGARLVGLSTDLVFPGRVGGSYREHDPVGPLSRYGESKLVAERAMLSLDPSALVVRTSLILAAGAAGHVARLRRELAGPGARLFTDELRSPILASDLARALLELGLGDAQGLLHVAGPEGLSRHALGLLLAAGLGLDARRITPAVRAEAGPPARPGDVTLASDVARARLRTRIRRVAEAVHELA